MKRTRPLDGDGEGVLTPDLFSKEKLTKRDPIADYKGILSTERRYHAKVIRFLARQLEAQERQIADLRTLYISTLALKVGPIR